MGVSWELRAHEKKKKKDFPNPLDIEVTGPDLWPQLWENLNFENKNFVFMVLMAQFRACELRSDKKKKRFSQPHRHRSHRSATVVSILEKSKFLVLWS